MTCYHPIHGYRTKRGSVVNEPNPDTIGPASVPCGQCKGCRLERSRQWAIRCLHESQTHKKNTFITLTYSDENLPQNMSLDKEAFPKFIRAWRKKLRALDGDQALRYFHCGEYGDEKNRPHYHAVIFGQDFWHDQKQWKEERGQRYYTSATLNNLWPYGHAVIGEVTFESAAYVARYIMKKINGAKKEEHYYGRQPEYTTMSRRPGIGTRWYEKFGRETFRDDFCIINGRKARPPKFYETLLEKDNPTKYAAIKIERIRHAQENKANNTPERLAIRKQCMEAKTKTLYRNKTETT